MIYIEPYIIRCFAYVTIRNELTSFRLYGLEERVSCGSVHAIGGGISVLEVFLTSVPAFKIALGLLLGRLGRFHFLFLQALADCLQLLLFLRVK